ncbi:MAG TPA: asparagine synthase (glutamine-hydrolyzing) [Thermoanaerobaculia bacterium]|nr:asparagine synthase (glutamine-hydrolyzing) [Thermoanaerobaculia bacterium]
MCGIFGGLALTEPFSAQTEAALRGLSHRGPDGEGLLEIGDAVLGHRRLSVIDPSPAGGQPMWDARRRVVTVFNGEIYNYRELRQECRAAGLEFRSESDTEVILNQYLIHGTKVFDRLNGMFALALYDTRSGEAYLARDPFGIKPLYYARTGGGLYFSSELQTLLATEGVDRRVDGTALQAYLQLDYVPTPYSIVRGVRKLDSGSFLRVTWDGAVTIEPYFVRRPAEIGDDPAGQLAEIIDAAVARHVIADVPLGVFLSGGIDSSIVADAARRVTGRPVSTFSIGFEEPSFDESRYFGIVADALGVTAHTRTLSARTMLDLIPRIARISGEPLADGSIYPTYLLAQFAREHVTVALSGDGADELFAGYPTYFAHAVARRIPAPLAPLLRTAGTVAHAVIPVSFENLSTDYKLKKFLDGFDADLIRRHIRWMGTFSERDLPHLLIDHDRDGDRAVAELLLQPAASRDHWLEKLLRTDQRFYLQDGVLVKVDRASMAHSLEVRVPFLDRAMIAFADGLDAHAKLRGRTSKVILRRHAASRFPPMIAGRPKKGFGAPLGHWFRSELRPMLDEVFSVRRIEERGIFRPSFVRNLLEAHWSGRRDHRKQIFNLLSFALWHDHFAAGGSVARADAA